MWLNNNAFSHIFDINHIAGKVHGEPYVAWCTIASATLSLYSIDYKTHSSSASKIIMVYSTQKHNKTCKKQKRNIPWKSSDGRKKERKKKKRLQAIKTLAFKIILYLKPILFRMHKIPFMSFTKNLRFDFIYYWYNFWD